MELERPNISLFLDFSLQNIQQKIKTLLILLLLLLLLLLQIITFHLIIYKRAAQQLL